MLKKQCKLHCVCHSHIAGPPQPLCHCFWLLLRYLVSRGSLLLTVFDTQGQQQLLSLQEATHLFEHLLEHTFSPVADELTPQPVLADGRCSVLASSSVVKFTAVACCVQESAGVSIAQYQVYCHLMRAGFIAARQDHSACFWHGVPAIACNIAS